MQQLVDDLKSTLVKFHFNKHISNDKLAVTGYEWENYANLVLRIFQNITQRLSDHNPILDDSIQIDFSVQFLSTCDTIAESCVISVSNSEGDIYQKCEKTFSHILLNFVSDFFENYKNCKDRYEQALFLGLKADRRNLSMFPNLVAAQVEIDNHLFDFVVYDRNNRAAVLGIELGERRYFGQDVEVISIEPQEILTDLRGCVDRVNRFVSAYRAK